MGRLLVVGTPIGNLEDITYRAVRALGEVTLILAEDTRQTAKLLARYDIATPMLSYHQHNKIARIERALVALAGGDIALVSSAGMPTISDPGFELVAAAVAAGIEIDVLPGANAAITAVAGAALPANGFLVLGFLPRRPSERRARLREVEGLTASLVLYESPRRLRPLLADLLSVLGDRAAVVARELTKVHQEYIRGPLSSLESTFTTREPRGEVTVVVAPVGHRASPPVDAARDEMARRRLAGEARREAIDAVMARFAVSRNAAYALWLAAGGTTDVDE